MVNQNAARGVVLSAIALCFGLTALSYPIGSFAHAGAGLFPLMISSLLLLIGLLTLVKARFEPAKPLRFEWRNIGIILSALVAFVVMTRFFKEFRDSALALVLEKRFPNVLGDRLITAVELHNPKAAAKYGYSPELVAQTIHEAADRVEQVPVGQVFAWGRLYAYGLVLIYLSAGLYLLTAAGFATTTVTPLPPEPDAKGPALFLATAAKA